MNQFRLVADLSIPLHFGGPQPNAYGVPIASARSLGDTRRGSGVNYEEYTFTPHCSGTHTECVGHITDERISIRDCLMDVIVPAIVVSCSPELIEGEMVITRNSLDDAGARARDAALIIRTLPNDDSKVSRVYDEENLPPYFSADAISYLVESGCRHLLCDMPSIDRLVDGGKLENHRIFWNVPAGSKEVNADTRTESTITELIYVPDTVSDGRYYLNLQIAPLAADAAPSRPLLLDGMFESRL